jgi:hypothetical protein
MAGTCVDRWRSSRSGGNSFRTPSDYPSLILFLKVASCPRLAEISSPRGACLRRQEVAEEISFPFFRMNAQAITPGESGFPTVSCAPARSFP